MQILINPTEVELKPIQVNPKVGYIPTNILEARDKDGRLLAILSIEITQQASYLIMNSFGRIYKTTLSEECIEIMLNQANLTTRKKLNED